MRLVEPDDSDEDPEGACGVGSEAVLLLPPLLALRRRRRSARASQG
jgi:hypothetical protein